MARLSQLRRFGFIREGPEMIPSESTGLLRGILVASRVAGLGRFLLFALEPYAFRPQVVNLNHFG